MIRRWLAQHRPALTTAVGSGLVVATVVAVAPAAAQQTTGKVEGTVSDQAGVKV